MLTVCVFCPPPDKGTVQKVIVLPSNQSLHEDLILEELEVFKVSCLFCFLFCFLFFSFYSALTFIISKSKARRRKEGEFGHTTKATDKKTDKRWVAFRRWTLCSVVQRGVMGNTLTDGTEGTLFFAHVVLS